MNDMTAAQMHEQAHALHQAELLAYYQRLYFEQVKASRSANKGIAHLRRKLDRARREAIDVAANVAHAVRVADGVGNLERLKWALFGAAAGIGVYKLAPWIGSLL